MAGFLASARELDRGVGIVLAALERDGLFELTIVVCTTDHGLAFRGKKGTVRVHGTGVMLLIRGPGAFSGGRVSDALVSHIDVFPTVCNLTATPRSSWLQGRSLLPLVAARHRESVRDLETNEAVFAEVTYNVANEPQRAVRTPRWIYDRTTPVVANCDGSPSRAMWLVAGWADQAQPAEALFDSILDPLERANLATDPADAAILADLRDRLAAWMAATDDSLLAGEVPLTPDEPLLSS